MAPRDSVIASLKLGRTWPHGVMPDLDTDVMEAICGSIDDIHDLLSVSLTCSVMWRIAIRQLLRTHTIHLKSRKAIRGFREFILNQKPTRAHHIRSLVIPEIAWTADKTTVPYTHLDDVGDHLMDILDCAVNLDTLDLSLDNYSRAGRARSAFAGMGALRHLSLSDPYLFWAHGALSALRSPPVTLCLRTNTLSASSVVSVSPLATYLDRFSSPSILTTLRLEWIHLYDNSPLTLPQFRSVRSVIITQVQGEPRLDAFLHLFPCLDGTLRLRLTAPVNMTLSASNRRRAQIQEENRRAQDVSHWTRLDRLDCESTTAFMLGLQCPIRHLTIDRFDTSVLAGIQMQHLVISSIYFPQDFAAIKDYTAHTPSLTGGSYPTHVVLIVRYEAEDYVHERSNFIIPRRNENVVLDSTVRALSLFPHVTHARLVFHCYKDHALRDELDEYDLVHQMRECASISPSPQVLTTCPSLRYFVVTAAGRDESQSGIASHGGWLRTRAWRVVEGEGVRRAADRAEPAPRRLEELGDYAAKRVIEAEDLGLPEEWERKLASCRM